MKSDIFIDDTGVTTDNRDLGETWLIYTDMPEMLFRVSIPFALELVKNAFENAPGGMTLEESAALAVLDRCLKGERTPEGA